MADYHANVNGYATAEAERGGDWGDAGERPDGAARDEDGEHDSDDYDDYDTDTSADEEDGDYDAADEPARKAELRALVEELKAQRAAKRAAAAAAEVDDTPLAEQIAACGTDDAAFRELGVCVVRGALTDAQVEQSSKLAHEVGASAEAGKYTLSQQRTAGRYDLVVPQLAADEYAFAHRDAPWMDLGRRLLGGEPTVAYMGVLWTTPSAQSQQFHADGRPLFAEGLDVQAEGAGPQGPPQFDLPPYAINVFMPLVDVDGTNGPTEFIPRSHRHGYPKGPVKPARVDLKAGDALLFDFRVVHRGAGNTGDLPPPVLYTVLCRPWFRDTVNWPQVVRKYWENVLAPNDDCETEKRERDEAMAKVLG
eukprot:PRCOL_00005162-RA